MIFDKDDMKLFLKAIIPVELISIGVLFLEVEIILYLASKGW